MSGIPKDYASHFTSQMARVQQHAKTNGWKLTVGKPWKDAEIDGLGKSVKPHFGEFRFPVPPRYRIFLKTIGSVSITGEDADEYHLHILNRKQVVEDAANLVHVPKDTTWAYPNGKECTITTNHLVPFATEDAGARWCFSTDKPDADGELAVYYFHADEPTASKDLATGEWVENPKPDYPNFAAWFDAYVDRFITGERYMKPYAE